MPDRHPDSALDRLAELITMLAGHRLAPADGAELNTLIHAAVHPMCRHLLGNADTADEAEQEVWRRLLEHLHRRDKATAPIVNGTAYVRQIARNVCYDLGRRITEQRREVPMADQQEAAHLAAVEHGRDDVTITRARTPHDDSLTATFGYRSRRILDELAALSEQERAVLCLRQEGWPYARIAEHIGDGLTAATAQRQGERAVHHLRGRAHVVTWLQEPVGTWEMPHCPQLARLKAKAQVQLAAGAAITATLYRDIGKHLDPHPNRRKGETDDPACPNCRTDRNRSEQIYWLLLGALPPLLAIPATAAPAPAAEPAAYHQDAAVQDAGSQDAEPSDRRKIRRPRSRVRMLTAAAAGVVVVLVATAAWAFVPPLLDPDGPNTAAPGGRPPGPGAGSRRPCDLLTQDEVDSATGQPFGPCLESTADPADAKVVQQVFGSDFDVLYEGKGCGTGTWPSDNGHTQVYVCQYAKPAEAFAAIDKLLRGFGSLGATQFGTVPGLGDENTSVVMSGAVPGTGLAELVVRRGDVLIAVSTMYDGAALDAVTQLTRLVAGRLA